MNLEIYNKIFNKVRDYLTNNSAYAPYVVKGVPDKPKYPLVVFTEINNSTLSNTTRFEEVKDNYIYEFDIYASNKVDSNTEIAGITIAREIAGLIDNVMANGGAKRISSRPTPNVNKTLCRIVSRYNID